MKAGGGGGAKPGGDISSLVSKSTALPQTSQFLSQYLSQSPLPIPHPLPPFLTPLLSLFPQTPSTQVCTREDLIIPCRQNQRPPPLVRQLVFIRCSKPYKYSLFSLISYYFSFPFLMFTASGFPPGRRPKLRREGLPSFALTILSCPRPLAEQNPEMMASCLSSLLFYTPKSEILPGEQTG